MNRLFAFYGLRVVGSPIKQIKLAPGSKLPPASPEGHWGSSPPSMALLLLTHCFPKTNPTMKYEKHVLYTGKKHQLFGDLSEYLSWKACAKPVLLGWSACANSRWMV